MSLRTAAATLLALLLLACTSKESIPPEVVARIGPRSITLDDYKRYLDRNAGTELAQIVPEAASALLDQYIQEILLSEYAAKNGIEISAEQVASAVRADPGSTANEKRDELRRDALLAELAGENGPPTADQVRAHYQQFIRDFRFDERVRVSQIMVQDETLARDLVARLGKGESFQELSEAHSAAPNASRGGEIGWITRNDLPRVFETEIFSLQPGQYSGVIRTDTGFYIFHVTDRQPAGTMPFEAAEPMIRQRMAEDAARRQISNLLIAARESTPTTILVRRLPFAYSGTLPASSTE